MSPAAPSINRQWVLSSRPAGLVKESDFAWREVPVPAPSEGQFLVRNLYLSFDPAMRGWMEDRPSYVPPVAIGEVMRAGSVAQVVESKNPVFRPGEFVQGTFGWQDYAVSDGRGPLPVSKLPPGVPLTWPLGVLGITGLTAYFGLLDLGNPAAGETAVVSGAAGATGSVAAQIAKLKGCRVIGIAGGRDKCAWLRDVAGLDAAIDYKAEDVGGRLRALCPRRIDLYFDNVGGPILDAVLAQIAVRARIVLCGGISSYNASSRAAPARPWTSTPPSRRCSPPSCSCSSDASSSPARSTSCSAIPICRSRSFQPIARPRPRSTTRNAISTTRS
ncbi:MAG TPA: NADP-dependent oxidoreductase [Myxococcota bacterium]|nr:NADP-dependent oxidoreductase [Myxococcota bacterium]